MHSKVIPLSKRSKKAQREYHLAGRGSWNGVVPVTKRIPDRKKDSKGRLKPEDADIVPRFALIARLIPAKAAWYCGKAERSRFHAVPFCLSVSKHAHN